MGASTSTDLIKLAQVPMTLLAATGLDGIPWPHQAKLIDNSSYDYIVVGAGTAGCVMARRLAEDKNNTVLAIEAGDDPPITALLHFSSYSLVLISITTNTSTRDEHAARGQNNFTALQAGKMLGGSASMNHFIHIRGTAGDYDCWAKIVNDSGWNYHNVLPYFKKSERLVDAEINSRYGKYHGTDGPMGISRQPSDKVDEILESFAEVGNPTVLDLNANVYVGYTQTQFMLADKKRQTPAYSYLEPIKDYSNLYVSKNTRVTKIIFKNKIAVAVEAVHKGKTYTFKANKGIIICAGVYNTPQLLMLSGIGPKEHLKAFNIDVISDLPVGDIFMDQVSVSLVHKIKKYLVPIPDPATLPINPTKVPFPILLGSVALNKSQLYPDYQTFVLKLAHDTPFLTLACAAVFELRNEICDMWKTQGKSWDTLYTLLTLIQPQSSGTVRLNSTNPFDDPLITTGYFTKDEDLQDMLKYVKDFINVTNSKHFQENGAELLGLDLKECADKKKYSDAFWICYILNHASSSYHGTSTCPMGTVVDSKLKVKGVEGLWVVDASVMPKIPHGAPNAAVIMLAEKASDMIKNEKMSVCSNKRN